MPRRSAIQGTRCGVGLRVNKGEETSLDDIAVDYIAPGKRASTESTCRYLVPLGMSRLIAARPRRICHVSLR
jgi:hypothetical protein